MCDSETKRRFTRVDGALQSLTNDLNDSSKDMSKRMGAMEVSQAVMLEKHTSMIDKVDDLIVMFKEHMVEEEDILEKGAARMTTMEGVLDRAKYTAIGVGLTITIIGTIFYNGFNAVMRWIGVHG